MRVALVLGGAACVWDDLNAALPLGEYQGVTACNDVGVYYPGPLDAFVSLHADKLEKIWLRKRRERGYPEPRLVAGKGGEIAHMFAQQMHSGSSGLFALKVAIEDLAFDRAVLCGIPMAPESHFFDAEIWRSSETHKRGWKQALPVIRDRARSMSGWTAEKLGRPDARWVAGQ